MLKIKAPLKKLSAAVALGLLAGTVSANSVLEEVSIYETYKYIADPFAARIQLQVNKDDWRAGYFKVDAETCPNGCDITQARITLDLSVFDFFADVSLAGLTAEIYSNKFKETAPDPFGPGQVNIYVPESWLFTLTTPETVLNDGDFGTDVWFSAPTQDPIANALLQPNTAYWLKISNSNDNRRYDLIANGNDKPNEWWASYNAETDLHFQGFGSPRVFEIMGIPRPVPVPGAIWLMGTALIGLLASKRNKSI